jgi:aminoglycoside phosphotransferase (APT) family kinase protein
MTPSWFERVLGKAGVLGGAEVVSAAVAPIGGGAIARMVRAELAYGGPTEAPPAVIVKFPTDDPGSLAVAQAMGLYELEVRFYQDIAPLVPNLSRPRCYLAEIDESSRFVLVMEDLSGRTKPGDVLTASTLEECANTLEQLVNLQAPTWNSKTVADLNWIADPTRTHQVFDGLAAGLRPFVDRFGHGLAAEHVTLFEKVLPHAGEWARSWSSPTVVQHGDFRSDNVLVGISADAPSATVIDFQTVRLGPPGVDPAYFLGSSLPTADRRVAERDLITDYHHKLVAAGVDGFDFDDCWSAYREGALYGVCLFVGMASQVESTERTDRIIVDQIRRYADMAIDLDSLKVAGLS